MRSGNAISYVTYISSCLLLRISKLNSYVAIYHPPLFFFYEEHRITLNFISLFFFISICKLFICHLRIFTQACACVCMWILVTKCVNSFFLQGKVDDWQKSTTHVWMDELNLHIKYKCKNATFGFITQINVFSIKLILTNWCLQRFPYAYFCGKYSMWISAHNACLYLQLKKYAGVSFYYTTRRLFIIL